MSVHIMKEGWLAAHSMEAGVGLVAQQHNVKSKEPAINLGKGERGEGPQKP